MAPRLQTWDSCAQPPSLAFFLGFRLSATPRRRNSSTIAQHDETYNPHQDEDNGDQFRLGSAYTEYLKNGVNADALDQKPLGAREQKIKRKQPARTERVLSRAPENREADERVNGGKLRTVGSCTRQRRQGAQQL